MEHGGIGSAFWKFHKFRMRGPKRAMKRIIRYYDLLFDLANENFNLKSFEEKIKKAKAMGETKEVIHDIKEYVKDEKNPINIGEAAEEGAILEIKEIIEAVSKDTKNVDHALKDLPPEVGSRYKEFVDNVKSVIVKKLDDIGTIEKDIADQRNQGKLLTFKFDQQLKEILGSAKDEVSEFDKEEKNLLKDMESKMEELIDAKRNNKAIDSEKVIKAIDNNEKNFIADIEKEMDLLYKFIQTIGIKLTGIEEGNKKILSQEIQNVLVGRMGFPSEQAEPLKKLITELIKQIQHNAWIFYEMIKMESQDAGRLAA